MEPTWLEIYARLYAEQVRDRNAEIAALLVHGYRIVYNAGGQADPTTTVLPAVLAGIDHPNGRMTT